MTTYKERILNKKAPAHKPFFDIFYPLPDNIKTFRQKVFETRSNEKPLPIMKLGEKYQNLISEKEIIIQIEKKIIPEILLNFFQDIIYLTLDINNDKRIFNTFSPKQNYIKQFLKLNPSKELTTALLFHIWIQASTRRMRKTKNIPSKDFSVKQNKYTFLKEIVSPVFQYYSTANPKTLSSFFRTFCPQSELINYPPLTDSNVQLIDIKNWVFSEEIKKKDSFSVWKKIVGTSIELTNNEVSKFVFNKL